MFTRYEKIMIGGVDEAGRGPVIGPLVVAGVTFENDLELIENNVRDSKKITPKRRKVLAKKIKETALNYEIIVISANDIDDMRKAMTLNEIEVNAFSKVIDKLRPKICYVDSADVNDKRFGRDILSRVSFKPEIISKHKADDKYPIVGAASILAKTRRDEEIVRIERELKKKLNMPLGSGYPADPVTQKFIKTWLSKFGELPPYIRRSWSTARKLFEEQRIKKLDDF
jgi:ribonuclease HII